MSSLSPPPVQMPNVFVVPPDEDESPAWCFFDANRPDRSISPDTPVDDAPSFVFPPRRARADGPVQPSTRETVSAVDAIVENDHNRGIDCFTDTEDEDDEVVEDDVAPPDSPTMPDSPSEPTQTGAEDSLVVEVFKVKHIRQSHEGQADVNTLGSRQSDHKRTKTLRSRASRVFRSIRGTIRSSSKPRHQQEPIPSTIPPVPPIPPIPPVPPLPAHVGVTSSKDTLPRTGPTVSRRASTMLSLFKNPSIKSQSSTLSFNASAPVSSEDLHSSDSPPSIVQEVPSLPPRESNASSSHRLSVYDTEGIDDTRLRAASPTPTTASTKSTHRRFSVLSLQKLFTLPSNRASSSTSHATPADDRDQDRSEQPPRPPSRAAPSASSSITTASGSVPQTPTSVGDAASVCIRDQDEHTPSLHHVLEGGFGSTPHLTLSLDLDDYGASKGSQLDTPRGRRSYNTLGTRTPTTATPKAQQRFTSAPQTPTRRPRRGGPTGVDHQGDVSFEMQLDSLHFDDLSFDAGRFSLSSP